MGRQGNQGRASHITRLLPNYTEGQTLHLIAIIVYPGEHLKSDQTGIEKLDDVCIHPNYLDHKVQIGACLSTELQLALIEFLTRHHDCFAWSHKEKTGIDPDVAVHRLQVDPDHPPIKQKQRKFTPERNKVFNEEVQKLLDIGSVREVHYPDWLANVVVVRKKNGKWRVCIDFTDLNKACPKDSFPLPHIDMLVDATAGHELLSFMDQSDPYASR